MDTLKRLLSGAWSVLRWLWSALGSLLAALFGSVDWYAPDWVRVLGYRLRERLGAWRAWARSHPAEARRRGFLGGLGALLVVGLAGWPGYAYLTRPIPETVGFTVVAPERTCYECEPAGKPNPLRVRFSASVAPLETAGKLLAADQTQGWMNPGHPGVWRWEDDRVLRFEPAEDWPVGETYAVSLAGKGLIAPHQRLDSEQFEFRSPAFAATPGETEFYQDPTVATDKKAVFTLRFTHPVDPKALESRLQLKLFENLAAGARREAGEVAYQVSYDELKLEAYITSEAIPVPAKDGTLVLNAASGLRAERGGNSTAEPLSASVTVPGLNSLASLDLRLDIARDDASNPKQVLITEWSHSVAERSLPERLSARLLPLRHPDPERQRNWEQGNGDAAFDWASCGCVGVAYDNRVLDAAAELPLNLIPGEREHAERLSFAYQADPARFIYLRVDKGLTSFGGYVLDATQERVLEVPAFPRELRLTAPGSLLALSGERRVNVLSRDVPALRVEVSRLLPRQLQHLVTQTGGEFSEPQFENWRFQADHLSERLTRIETLPRLAPGTPHYTALDLSEYLAEDSAGPRGVFLLKLTAWDTTNQQPLFGDSIDDWGNPRQGLIEDQRLLVITDLGLLLKRNADGSRDVFVQSIADGRPVSGAQVEVIGRNGVAVASATTGDDGHVRFEPFDDDQREREPVLLLARLGTDQSFIPIDYRIRALDLSRFDVGGVSQAIDPGALSAYLFSDRGIYRPGEEIRAGAIVRRQDWAALPAGLPLRFEVVDPQGRIVKQEPLRLSASALEDLRYTPSLAAPAGNYTLQLSIVRDEWRSDLIGSLPVTVRDFQPDRLRMRTTLSNQQPAGWVAPDGLAALIDLQNLFGAPAQGRRVTATLRLTPQFPAFEGFRDYQFFDPQLAKEGFTEELAETLTDAQGAARLELGLERFAKATYRLQVVAQGYEPDGGRGVASEVSQRVSNLPFLVGWKADGDLGFVSRDAQRSVHFIAISPAAELTVAEGLVLSRSELSFVSTLTKQGNGTFKYESRQKEAELSREPLAIAGSGTQVALASDTPGRFVYRVLDAQGQVLASLEYSVAGEANLSTRLEKNAELQLSLAKNDFAPGEEIEVQITAPYAGAGLITIERERVLAWQWFRSETTASVQRIRVPEGLEGSAYVSVSFVRDPASPEVFTSPLSYGVVPFSVALDARRLGLTLQTPARVRPGETAQFSLSAERPARAVLFAVDEGILQVARYRTPDPIAHFFAKRSLDVDTQQILDLILPEFRLLAQGAAPGGDADGLLARHLNPFRRKGEPPVAYWSGVVDVGPEASRFSYTVPDGFNGKLRVMALALDARSMGVAEGETTVKADLVLQPDAPLFVAPGDRFEVGVGVSNQIEGSGPETQVTVALTVDGGLKPADPAAQTLTIGENREGRTVFSLEASDPLGPAELVFSATADGKTSTRRISLSVRPAVPYRTRLEAGRLGPGKTLDLDVQMPTHLPFSARQVSVSPLPLVLAEGLAVYLRDYPYACTEQLASRAMPALIVAGRPELGEVIGASGYGFSELIDELRSRQNPDGAYRLWAGGPQTDEFVSVYIQHVLLEARERGEAVPAALLALGNEALLALARRDGDGLEQERVSAYALYLLVRQGQVLGAEASRLRQRLSERYPGSDTDIASAFLAAALQGLQQTREAERLISRLRLEPETGDDWFHGLTADAFKLYLLSRHFPTRLESVPPALLERMTKAISDGAYHSLSSATLLLALDAYAAAVGAASAGQYAVSERSASAPEQPLSLSEGLFSSARFAATAERLKLSNQGEIAAFWQTRISGFESQLPEGPWVQGLEVRREIRDAQGNPLKQIEQGQEATVVLSFRAVDRAVGDPPLGSVALVDLLPGGFELVVPPQDLDQPLLQASDGEFAAEGEYQGDGGGYGEEYGEGDYGAESAESAAGWRCPICVEGTSAALDYADFRDDRAVFYATATPDLQTIAYRVKATQAGRFVVPPAYAEALYEPTVQARSSAGQIQVLRP